MKHSTLTMHTFMHQLKFTVDHVWSYLLDNSSPWGDDNYELYRLYSDSSSGECPLVVDKTVKESAVHAVTQDLAVGFVQLSAKIKL